MIFGHKILGQIWFNKIFGKKSDDPKELFFFRFLGLEFFLSKCTLHQTLVLLDSSKSRLGKYIKTSRSKILDGYFKFNNDFQEQNFVSKNYLVQKHFGQQIFGSKRFLIQEIRGEKIRVQLWAKLDKNQPVYSFFSETGTKVARTNVV